VRRNPRDAPDFAATLTENSAPSGISLRAKIAPMSRPKRDFPPLTHAAANVKRACPDYKQVVSHCTFNDSPYESQRLGV
jgi:hypothetical protein